MAERTCSIDGCDGFHYGRGWCSKHYHRWYRYGDPEHDSGRSVASPGTSRSERFWMRVDVRGPDDCWEWQGYRRASGYGRYESPGHGVVTASRFAYEDRVGPIPDGMLICHTCDNPPCVNPNHLWPGTHKDNAQDMLEKGRHAAQASPGYSLVGEAHPLTTLSREQVVELRRLRNDEGATYNELGDMFNVTSVTARNICLGKTWSHVPDYLEDVA